MPSLLTPHTFKTGNTVFAALGVSNLPAASQRLAWTKSLCAILCFSLGAISFSSLHRLLSPRKRWVLMLSFTIQATFILISAVMIKSGNASDSPVKEKPSKPNFLNTIPADPGFPWIDLVPIGLLSFQGAGKVVASRVLQYTALPTVVLTTLYNDLMSDPGLLTDGLLHNSQRNRRIGGVVFFFSGAVLGGVFVSSAFGFAGALWVAAAVKGGIVCAWFVWKEEVENEDED